ncbi:diguanylate cyclase [Deinococcus sedimenti]|uniref:Diguanylate cyclase response regulator n=1 Tax=Deinococcus sedimenti TaxID=1867090 RepID=A0ABQ2SB07_9DEIO|nr:diguanylate cyclase [Deinococcus sedimenti]GGS03829.1 diguanylate cyclase response regulator [Deinococcus sedimenti]
MNILIIDDSALIRALLTRTLTPLGTVHAPPDLHGARDLLGFHTGHCDLDVVLLDLEMPELDGLSFLRDLRAHPHLADLSVVMVTSTQETERLDDAFTAGATDYVTKPAHDSVLRARTLNAARLSRALRAAKTRERELAAANAQLEQLSRTDALTGLANRRAFDQQYAHTLALAQRTGVLATLIMVDLDHFKRYNDTLGHPAGDTCLQQVARILQASCQRRTDLAARYGGEEFALLLTDTDLAGAQQVAQRVHSALQAAAIPHPGHPLGRVTVSLGIASTAAPDLKDAADQALYRAKASGRNTTAT